MQVDEGETVQPVEEYTLMEWLKDEALKAHNKCAGMYPDCERAVLETREEVFNEVITNIQNGRVNQRPHVKERI